MRTRLGVMATIAMSVLALTACASGGSAPEDPGPTTPPATAQPGSYEPYYHGSYYEKLPDGYDMLCVYAKSGNSGGVSCDWEGHRAWLEKK